MIDDYDIQVAERRRAALLANIVLPSDHREPGWVLVVERLMSRGVTTPAHLSDVLEQPISRCREWCEEVRQRWRASVPSDLADERREELYQRTMAVADMAVLAAQGMADSAGAKPKYLKTALAAYDKAGDLAGVKGAQEVVVEGTVELVVRRPREVLEGYGIGDLKALGSVAARGLREREMAEMEVREMEEADVVDDGDGVVDGGDEVVLEVVKVAEG